MVKRYKLYDENAKLILTKRQIEKYRIKSLFHTYYLTKRQIKKYQKKYNKFMANSPPRKSAELKFIPDEENNGEPIIETIEFLYQHVKDKAGNPVIKK